MSVPVPTAAEVATTLGRSDDISVIYDAEVADQASRCRTDPYTSALAAALVRRCARALSMRNLPLGVTLDETAVRIGSTDPEVRRLEAPYRRLVIG